MAAAAAVVVAMVTGAQILLRPSLARQQVATLRGSRAARHTQTSPRAVMRATQSRRGRRAPGRPSSGHNWKLEVTRSTAS